MPVEARSPAIRPATEKATRHEDRREIQASSPHSGAASKGPDAETRANPRSRGALIRDTKLVADLKPGTRRSRPARRRSGQRCRAVGPERALAGIKKDGASTAVVESTVANAGGETQPVDDPRRPLEERAKLVWDNSPETRAEYEKMGGFESYLAWRRAEDRGDARILKAVK